MRTLYFGGSFNPVHVGHLICARAVAETCGFRRIVLIPSAQPPHKSEDKTLAPPGQRLQMCQLVAENDPLFAASDIELRRSGPSYTIDTARELRRTTGQPVSWLIGADMAAILPQWHESQALLREVEFVLMARPGWDFDWPRLPEPFRSLHRKVVPAPLITISGTDIRRRVKERLPITYLVLPTVEQFIRDNRLYTS